MNQLSAGQLNSLKDIVHEKQDALFNKLQKAVTEKNEVRAESLRENLRYWDSISQSVSQSAATAWNKQHAKQAGCRIVA